ncbi:hypothetical protein ACS0TY_027576 [Phlomoides rotata]
MLVGKGEGRYLLGLLIKLTATFTNRVGQSIYKGKVGSSIQCDKWHLPAPRKMKLNIDATLFAEEMVMSIGMVLRDDTCCFLLGHSMFFHELFRAREVEIFGLHEALSWIKILGMDNVEVEIDPR